MAAPTQEQELRLGDYLRILRQNWQLPLLFGIVFAGATGLYVKELPNRYSVSARILIESRVPQVVEFREIMPFNPREMQTLNTELEILQSRAVLKTVVEELNLAAFPPFSRSANPDAILRRMVQVRVVPDSRLIDITVSGSQPELITRIANTWADVYARQNLERRQALTIGGVQWLQEEVTKMEEKVRDAQLNLQAFLEEHSTVDFGEERQNSVLQRIQALNASITDTRKQRIEAEIKFREKHPSLLELQAKEKEFQLALFEQEQKALEMSRISIQYNALLRDVKTGESVYNILLTRLKELSIQEGLQSNNIQVVDYALVPGRPTGPDRPRTVAFAGFFGAVLGAGLAVIREMFNKKIRSRREFEQVLGIPFLGYFPFVTANLIGRKEPLLTGSNASTRYTESLRAIRTTLEFLLPGGAPSVLMVTSALPEEGKSVVASNLAISLRELNRRVILIDADMRRPTLHQLLGMPLEPGLSDYLRDKASLEEIVRSSSKAADLPVITAGITPPQPADLLAGDRMAGLLEALSKEYAYILLDTPPVLATADAAILSGIAHYVVYVTWAARTQSELSLAGKQRLIDVGAKIVGGVLNKSHPAAERSYGYGYGYYYHDKKSA